MPQPAPMKYRPGRPRVLKNARSTPIVIEYADEEYLRNLGDGNLSQGIRELIRRAKQIVKPMGL